MGITLVASKNFRIITLCGSAGALSAYQQILGSVPHDSGMAFVVLTHRRVGSTDRLAKILSWVTTMPVEEIEEGTVLLANRIYVIPAAKDLTTDGSLFRLVPISKLGGRPNRFDIFLTSLEKNTKNRAVTIILSGKGSDGSAALAGLRRGGGLAFAQSDAMFNSMPASAIATGNVDFSCSAVEIGTLVSALRPLSLPDWSLPGV